MCPPAGARDSISLGGSSLGVPIPGAPLAGPAGALGQGVSGIASTAATELALTTIQTSVSSAAASVLHETAAVLSQTTTPRLGSAWFSAVYWRVAGLAAILTLPFLFAASIQALVRSDLTLLIRAALGYLPLAMLAVAIAAPLTMLLLSASDELASVVSSAAGQESSSFLAGTVAPFGSVGAVSGSPFLLILLGLFTVGGALALWIELLMREAAVYVIVLMLPLAFAAFVWPARRIWAFRSLELLAALILSKFAIVAVLSLGGAALSHSVHASLAGMLTGAALLVLGAFTPWALLRLLPLTEIASGTAGMLRGQSGVGLRALQHADGWATEAHRWATTTARMRHAADEVRTPSPPPRPLATTSPPAGGDLAAPSGGDAAPTAAHGDATGAAIHHPAPDTHAPIAPTQTEPAATPGEWIVGGKVDHPDRSVR